MTGAAADVVAWVEAVRRSGGSRLDPARFRTIEALVRRVPELQEPVRSVIEKKLQQVVGDYAALIDAKGPGTTPAPPVRMGTAASPLAQLNQSLRLATATRAAPEASIAAGEPEDLHELASVRRFRQARERSRSANQVQQATARKPVNAGPLNSHALVLHSLELMRELSPDYLRRFLLHMESLQWLDQARERLPTAAKPVKPRRVRARK